MKLLDVNEYTCKIGKQDNVAKAPSSGNCWHMDLHVLSLVYVPTVRMFILTYLLYCKGLTNISVKKPTSLQMIEVV